MRIDSFKNDTLSEELLSLTHKSGLRIYLLPKQFNKSYAALATRYGSVDSEFISNGERISLPDGIAHYLEHKLFEKPDGTNAFDDYAKTGASANAYTSNDLTSYYFTCTSGFYESLNILLEFVSQPYFTPENVEKERGIIGQEIKMYDDHPGWRVQINLMQLLYHKHPVRRDIAGTVESIAKIDEDLLYKCYNTFYAPSNMILFIAGCFDTERVLEAVDRYIPNAGNAESFERVYPSEPPLPFHRYKEDKLSVSAPIFMLGFKEKSPGSDGEELLRRRGLSALALELLLGKSGECYHRLYNDGLINESFGYDYTYSEHYAFSAIEGESPDPKRVRDVILETAASYSPSPEDFERARKAVIGRFIRRFNNIERTGNYFVSNLFMGSNPLIYGDILKELTLAETQERIRTHICEEGHALSVVSPF